MDHPHDADHFMLRQKLVQLSFSCAPFQRWPSHFPIQPVAREFVHDFLGRIDVATNPAMGPRFDSMRSRFSTELASAPLAKLAIEDLKVLLTELVVYTSTGTFLSHWTPELSPSQKIQSLSQSAFARCIVLKPHLANAHNGLAAELEHDVDHLLRLWILKDISPQETRRLALMLPAYAQRMADRYWWRSPGKVLADGKEPIDVAHDVFEKVYSGQRRWDPRKNPSLGQFMRGVVDSELSNLVKSSGHLLREQLPDTAECQFDKMLGNSTQPAQLLEEQELFSDFRVSLADNPELLNFFDLIQEGYSLSEIREKMNCTQSQNFSRYRTLKRRTSRHLEDRLTRLGELRERKE